MNEESVQLSSFGVVIASRWSKVLAVNSGYKNELREASIWIRVNGEGKKGLPLWYEL